MPSRYAPLTCISRFRSSDSYYIGAGAADDPVGSATMTRIVVFVSLRPWVAGQFWAHTQAVGAARGGWRVRFDGTLLVWEITDGGTTARTLTKGAGDLESAGRVVVLIATHNGSTEMALRSDGTEVTAGPFAGFTAPILDPNTVGASPLGSGAATSFGIAALLASDSVALDATGRANAETIIQDNIRQGRDFDSGLSGVFTPEYYWDARDLILSGGATWTDRVASEALTRTGTPELIQVAGMI